MGQAPFEQLETQASSAAPPGMHRRAGAHKARRGVRSKSYHVMMSPFGAWDNRQRRHPMCTNGRMELSPADARPRSAVNVAVGYDMH